MKAPSAALILSFSLVLFFSLPSHSQIHTNRNVIYISGQVTNTTNGGPVAGHKIYIESDSATSYGQPYYSTIYTDIYGLYFDTIVTGNIDGEVTLSLLDFSNNTHAATKHYRFSWSDSYQMVTNFQIIDPNANDELQANFGARQDTSSGNPMQIIFRNLSVGYVMKSFEWDFGDGHFSEVEDPVHVYAEPGIYQVSLTISSTPLANDINNKTTSKITKQVLVGLDQYYNIGGHIFSGYFPIDHGLAYLYELDSAGQPIPIDTVRIDEYGYYYFYQIREADYLIKARLQSISSEYGNFIPTYYGDSHIWNEAETMHVDSENWNYHINLIPSDGMVNGAASLQGQIMYDTNTITTTYTPADNIELILLSSEEKFVTCRLSDPEGYFGFSGLEYGTYQIYPDVTGIFSDPLFITVSEDSENEYNLVIQPEHITFGIGETRENSPVGEFSICPNPVRENASVRFRLSENARITLLITDLKGVVVTEGEFLLGKGSHQVDIQAGHLSKGIYQVILSTGNTKPACLKMIKL